MTLLHRLASMIALDRRVATAPSRTSTTSCAPSSTGGRRQGARRPAAGRGARGWRCSSSAASNRRRNASAPAATAAWLDEVGRDVRYALPHVRQNPGFTAVVVLTLALGIGANTAIFSLIDALMLRWLPVRSPQELVQVTLQTHGEGPTPAASFSYAIVRALAEQTRHLRGRRRVQRHSSFDVGTGRRRRARARRVGHRRLLRRRSASAPVAGRLLAPGRRRARARRRSRCISDGYWQRQFGRSPEAIGRTLRINGVP